MASLPGARRAGRSSALLLLLLLAVALCARTAAGATCRWSVRRRSGWTGPAFPLSIAELSLVGSSSGALTASFTPSSTWGPAFNVSNLSDTQTSTFWASANGAATPSLAITWTCVPGERVRLLLTNRQLGSNNCGQACVDRLSSFSVFEETDAAGNTLATPVEHKLMWWSPMFYPTASVASNALLPLPANSSSQRIVIYEDAGLRNCFIWVSPVNPSATNTFINALQMEYLTGGGDSGSPSEAVPADRLYASMTGNFRGYEVTQCFDNQPASTPCASTSSPTPRMVIAGPCGVEVAGTRLQLNITNRPSSSPGCVGCADRLSKFTLTAAVARAGAHVMLPGSYTPPAPVPLALSYAWQQAKPLILSVDDAQGPGFLTGLGFALAAVPQTTAADFNGVPSLAVTPAACFASATPSLPLSPPPFALTYPNSFGIWTPGAPAGTRVYLGGIYDLPSTITLPQGTTAFGLRMMANVFTEAFTLSAAAVDGATGASAELSQSFDWNNGPRFFGFYARSPSATLTSLTIGPAPGVTNTYGDLVIACNRPAFAP